ncbi:UNVERIFIED_CONTAM: Transmembrane protein 97 [Siphonaria sp. JEL0065]|nr:Transmembrane protein 97 [Siphonaria sp. JEL0065]
MARQRPLSSRPGDIAILLFFVLHIPITVLMDAQLLFPAWTAKNYPKPVIQAALDYVKDTNDYLIMERQLWFISTLWCEMIVQFPFYLFLIHGLITDSKHVRTAGIIYGTHTCTILVPILYDMILNTNGIQSASQRVQTISIYSIWFFMPLVILYAMVFRTSGDVDRAKVKKQ